MTRISAYTGPHTLTQLRHTYIASRGRRCGNTTCLYLPRVPPRAKRIPSAGGRPHIPRLQSARSLRTAKRSNTERQGSHKAVAQGCSHETSISKFEDAKAGSTTTTTQQVPCRWRLCLAARRGKDRRRRRRNKTTTTTRHRRRQTTRGGTEKYGARAHTGTADGRVDGDST